MAQVAVSRGRTRLALARMLSRQSIVRFVTGRPPEPVLTSTFGDRLPAYSSDGRRIAFESRRNGESNEIWVADADGSNATQLTHGPGLWQGSPRWSPDGATIVFDSQGEDGSWDIWTIGSGGGTARRVTTDPANDNIPSWSRDGRFLYWTSDRRGAPGVYRAPVAGGAEERVSERLGPALETAAGRSLLVSHMTAPEWALRAVALDGGPERVAVGCTRSRGFAPAEEGLYYVGCTAGPRPPLRLLDPATGRDRLLGDLVDYDIGLAVAPGGRSILYTRVQGEGSDLVLIDNFR